MPLPNPTNPDPQIQRNFRALEARLGPKAISLDQLANAVAEALNPTGSVHAYAGDTAPDGYLVCDGSAVSRTTYAALFAAIGTTYGSGDGSTTFNVPNLKGRAPVGLDSSQTEFDALGETGGAKTHTLTTSELPSHSHAAGTLATPIGFVSNTTTGGSGDRYTGGVGSPISVTGSTATAGSGSAHNNLSPYITLNWIVKT